MKAYFIQLFNYDRYASLRILKSILETGEPGKAVQLMAHLLAAQQVWLNRCKNEPPIGGALWPDWKSNDLEEMINSNHQKWINFLEGLNDLDFDQPIDYKNSRGGHFANKLADVLAHVINHGTHHRAQAGQYLKMEGTELPNTDLIFYVRELNNKE